MDPLRAAKAMTLLHPGDFMSLNPKITSTDTDMPALLDFKKIDFSINSVIRV